jgi:hypothetical protein
MKSRFIDKWQKCCVCSKRYSVFDSLKDLNVNFFNNILDGYTTSSHAIEIVEFSMNFCSSECLNTHADNVYGSYEKENN